MPNRILKDSICTSKTIDELSEGAENLFYRLLVVVDDYGRCHADPDIVLARCYPRRLSLGSGTVQQRLDELVASGLIWVYEVESDLFMQVTSWETHQRVRSKKSRHPEPPSSDSEARSSDSEPPSHVPRARGIQSNPIQSNPGVRAELREAAPSDWTGLEHVEKFLGSLNGSVPDGFPITQLQDPQLWRDLIGVTENTDVVLTAELKLYMAWWPTKPAGSRHRNIKQGFRRWIKTAIGREKWRKESRRAVR